MDFVFIGILFALLLGWGPFYQAVIAPRVEPRLPAPAPGLLPDQAAASNAVAALPPGRETEFRPAPDLESAPVADIGPAATPPPVISEEAPVSPVEPDAGLAQARLDPSNVMVLSNRLIRLGISRLGGGIAFVEMLQFPESPKADKPLLLSFAAAPALALENSDVKSPGAAAFAALTAVQPFTIEVGPDARSARLTAGVAHGLRLERTVLLREDDYRVDVEDRFINAGPVAVALPAYDVRMGPLTEHPTTSNRQQGGPYLGVDSLSTTGGADVRHWGRSGFFSKTEALPDLFLPLERRGGGCGMSKPALTKPLPLSVRHSVEDRTDWVAVKDKFFTQILTMKDGAAGIVVDATRLVSPLEKANEPRSWATIAVLDGVSAGMTMDPVDVGPGQMMTRTLSYYVGPKEYSRIEPMGNRIVEIMEFGKLRPICWLLLVGLKWLYAAIPNYGVAIILLTILIRLVFWPVTHKSTESMKKMQEVQPMIAELRAKYKDKPQKLQEETMKLYKEHKVNPLGGCLPMLIQIPVFIALFNVLRSAVELRYAGFLWVPDLSEPEGLFPGIIPFFPGMGLNILPIIMTATSIWQSHLTPSGGDPNQQKMMLLMPLMMLFIFYNMPSALVLYWTANQVLMIVQLLWQKRVTSKTA